MLWIYARGAESLRFETRFDVDTEEFILISYGVSGSESQQIQRFKDTAAFKRKLVALETWLKNQGWQHTGAPLLRDGWKM